MPVKRESDVDSDALPPNPDDLFGSEDDANRVVFANPLFKLEKKRSSADLMREPSVRVCGVLPASRLPIAAQKSSNANQPTILYPHSQVEASWFKSSNWSVPDPNYKPVHFDSPDLLKDWADPPAAAFAHRSRHPCH